MPFVRAWIGLNVPKKTAQKDRWNILPAMTDVRDAVHLICRIQLELRRDSNSWEFLERVKLHLLGRYRQIEDTIIDLKKRGLLAEAK